MSGTVEYKLSNCDEVALIDKDDYDAVASFGKWYKSDSGYAIKKTKIKGKNVSVRMHALINKTPKGWHTDHMNGNRLDNRKSNLRTISAAMNAFYAAERRDWEKTTYPDLPKGVSFDKERNKYIARKTIYKRFETIEEAKTWLAVELVA